MAHPQSAIRNAKSPPPPVIGLLGGVGAGKSAVAGHFARLGCAVVDADRLGHAVLRQPAVREAVVRRFGAAVLDAEGEVDRGRLGRLVFENRESLEALEAIVDPELWRRVAEAVEAARGTDVPAVVLDAALILEKGLDSRCDFLVYVECPPEVRHRRAAQARGWEPAEVARREAAQVSLKAKQGRADYMVENRTSPEHTLEQVRQVLARVRRR